MSRLFMIVPVLAIGLALPAVAQQTSDHDAWQAGESVVQAHNKASLAKDAAGVAALYTEDVIEVTPDGLVSGRAALEKFFADGFKVFTPEPAKLDRVIMVGEAMRLRTGTWSGVVQSPNGPMPAKGYWATTDVRDGNTWKIRMETYNMTLPPPSEDKK